MQDSIIQTDFESLWNALHTRLCRFICSRIPDGDDAEDILQEVFIRMHAHLDTVREIDRLESWVYQIARNSIADYYRSRKRLVALEDYPVEDEHPEEDTAEMLAPALREAVESLPEPYREALLLTEYQGLSQQQLADRLGISFSGAKSRVQRGRAKVRDMLLTCCHFEFDARGIVIDFRERCCCCCCCSAA
jgi:RNA polymerase sigma-70 factor (ECF subfamily)